MADFRALAANLGAADGALAAAAEIAALTVRLAGAADRPGRADEVLEIRKGLEHLNSVLGRIRLGVKRRIAELESALKQPQGRI